MKGTINEEIIMQASIYTGNNRVEYVHNVSVALLLPPDANLTSGLNPLFIGEMGPGPAVAQCQWSLKLEEPGEHVFTVNASYVDTQYIPGWMSNSTTVDVYGPPHVEFEYTPTSDLQVNSIITFNATKSYPQGPNSQIDTYFWDFGDGTQQTTYAPIATHIYNVIGNYTVVLNVTDDSPFQFSAVNAAVLSIGLFGDLSGDGRVNILDVTIVALAYGSTPQMPNWNPKADLNNDGTVNILDIALVAREFGKTE
jgi:hypothetical protein